MISWKLLSAKKYQQRVLLKIQNLNEPIAKLENEWTLINW